jgi:hypothetical protein
MQQSGGDKSQENEVKILEKLPVSLAPELR